VTAAAVRQRKAPPGKYRLQLRIGDEVRVLYDPQPRQDALHACQAPNVMYGGQAGGGKSHALRWHGMMACARHKNLRVLLLRREFTELEKSHLLKLPEEVPPELATYNGSKHYLTFPGTGSVMVFGACQYEKDIGAYLSSEWDLILIDEASLFTPRMLRMLRTRLRSKNATIRPQFVLGTNPGGEGHLWIYQRFIAKNPAPEEERNYRPELWAFIPSALEDNEYLDAELYDAQFSGLTDEEYRAYRGGDWEAFAGQFFTDWRRATHVIPTRDPRWTAAPADWWEVMGCLDWGWSPHPGYFALCGFDQYGRGVGYKEFTFTECTPREVAEMIAARCVTEMERKAVIVGDTAMWTPQATKNGVSIATEINEALADLGLEVVIVQANKDRLNGWQRMKSWLKPIRKQPESTETDKILGPWLTFLEFDEESGKGCPYLIQTIHAQIYDEKKPGDMKKGAIDHGCDAWRYLLMAREPLATVPVDQRPGKTHAQRVGERTRKILDMVRAQHNRGLEMDDETAEARAHELGLRDDDEAEVLSDMVGDVWQ
jgi:hypothetical protein